MQRRSITDDDISYEPAESRLQTRSESLATSTDDDAYQGRHVRRENLVAGTSTVAAPPVNGSHPRRRGFGILSRLARVEADFSADAVAVSSGAHAALVDA